MNRSHKTHWTIMYRNSKGWHTHSHIYDSTFEQACDLLSDVYRFGTQMRLREGIHR
jgi:hypothetical protein